MTTLLAKVLLRRLSPGINWVQKERYIVHRSKKGQFRACRNICRHMYGLFVEQSESELICIRHGWILDPATMTYTCPAGKIRQSELRIERTKTHLLIYDAPEV